MVYGKKEEGRQSVIWVIVTALLQNKHLLFRMLITMMVLSMVFYMVRMLAYGRISTDYKDMLLIILGAILGNYTSVVNWWFHKDEEKELKK